MGSLTDEHFENPDQPRYRIYVPLTWAFIWAWEKVRPFFRSAGFLGIATLWWTPGDNTALGFRIYLGNAPGQYSMVHEVLGAKTKSAKIPLDETKVWFISVTAFNAAGESQHSNEISLPIPPPAPKNPKAKIQKSRATGEPHAPKSLDPPVYVGLTFSKGA